MSKMRIEFTAGTKAILAGRAGYECSHPECEVITIGPGDKIDQISSIGEAAHIYSASVNGPRGQNGLLEEDLRSVSNGIWLCKNHARLVDVNSGEGFTASELISWKLLHEESIKRKQGRMRRNVGWVSKIRIMCSPVFKDQSVINLGKVTLIESQQNGSGKTAICEWLAVLGSEKSPERWIPPRGKDIKYSINLFLPEKHEVIVSIKGQSYNIYIDGVDSSFCGIPFRSFFFSREFVRVPNRGELKESEYLCKILGVDIYTLQKLFDKIGFSQYSMFTRISLDLSDDEKNDIRCSLRNRNFEVCLSALSGGESNGAIFELLIAKMQTYAEYTPLILFIEAAEISFDRALIEHYLNFLNSSEIAFQTVVTSLSPTTVKTSIGVSHFVLEGANSNVGVIQV
ncbi:MULTISPECIES: hypothetical protein [unclassified Marinobacter]|uniref:hypothetical protein n=1 Tax=unclassified Marinobacter TaxID=83889 RepID=UPI00192541CA|nr:MULTISPECIES: hypothetical protein [unclassified Marinobacter]MBL3827214.1 hypothetical protein [Marinobacter sp. MC3]MBL3895696.1 hypothetical protein [Marinobacter sp. MW3]